MAPTTTTSTARTRAQTVHQVPARPFLRAVAHVARRVVTARRPVKAREPGADGFRQPPLTTCTALPDAVDSYFGMATAPGATWCLLRGLGVPMPADGGCYLVSCKKPPVKGTASGRLRLAAYLDPYGRAFSTDEFLTRPPACEPDVYFSLDVQDPVGRPVCDAVYTSYGYDGTVPAYAVEKAAPSRRRGGPAARPGDLACDETDLALAYLAFCVIPGERDVLYVQADAHDALQDALRETDVFAAMRTLADAGQTDPDALLAPSGFATYLSRLTRHAGLHTMQPADLASHEPVALPVPFVAGAAPGMNFEEILRAVLSAGGAATVVTPEGAVPLAEALPAMALPQVRLLDRTTYTDLHYVGFDRRAVSAKGAQRLLLAESLLNRAQLLDRGRVGDPAFQLASEHDALLADERLVSSVVRAALPFVDGSFEPRRGRSCTHSAAFNARLDFARGCESLELPFRLEYGFKIDVEPESRTLVVDFAPPAAALMPAFAWNEAAACLRERTPAEQEAMAVRYELQLAAVLAAVAFWAGDVVGSVVVNGWRVPGAAAGKGASPEPVCAMSAAFYRDAFWRATQDDGWLDDVLAFDDERALGSLTPFVRVGRGEDGGPCAVEPYESSSSLVLEGDLNLKPELDDHPLPAAGIELLHVLTVHGVGIYENAQRKADAHMVMEAFRWQGDRAALALVRDLHDRTENLLLRRACDEVSEGIANGSITEDSSKRVTQVFSDIYGLEAGYRKAAELAKTDAGRAAAQLEALVARADEQGWFRDTATRRYRYFDSYASRVVYAQRCADAGDATELRLVADEYYLACHRLSAIYSGSFDHVEQGIAYARRGVALAPGVASSHLRLARSYFCAFDYRSEVEALRDALAVAWNPTETGLALYWMGYALCMLDDYEAGVACYRRCVLFDPDLQEPAEAEVAEFLHKLGRTSFPMTKEEEDEALDRARVLVAAPEQNVDLLVHAAAVFDDAQSWGLAYNLVNSAASFLRDDAFAPLSESFEV